MRNIVYYVASSLDGYISGPEEDISMYVSEGSGVEQYLKDLQSFDTVIMGRRTYEFGYKFGLKPGQPAYPHMEHHIFSENMQLETPDPKVHVHPRSLDIIRHLKKKEGTDIYLCGGGVFAGWLLENELIDYLIIKLSPIILGSGIQLFGGVKKQTQNELIDTQTYDHGLIMLTYRIGY
ncbi:dihydrofolate reductase family protein [Catalinimonas niigatensis]|uniref:dihydrofolate reductase family protein n=1 Tax=Catalinimonas niigatensis TaxID=1397264 RepID=UPI002666D827|nr:dihydrofolate reductase family protein [Catalinimonas niigatensis]WPP50371.1 dihydrofolate reductase family protein [Catalinimonas niigatensis]